MWSFVKKTLDESRANSIVVADDAELKFAMNANTKYIFRGTIFWTTPAAGDFKHRLLGPISPSFVAISRFSIGPGSGVFGIVAVDGAYSTIDNVILGTGLSPGYLELNGIVHNGPNAGNFRFAWAQNSSNAGQTIVRAGSFLSWLKV